MQGFYGGLNGQDFSIKHIFPTRYQMLKDLTEGWTSSIQVGEFVEVSYGLPNEATYATRRDEDLLYYGKSYNSTLWRKDYNEQTPGRDASGLSYTLVASMTGATPKLEVNFGVVDADVEPSHVWDNKNIDNPILTLYLPRSQVLQLLSPATILNADEDPSVTLDETDINKPVLHFSLPQAQVIEQISYDVVAADEDPEVTFDKTDINHPIIRFKLPASQVLQEGLTTVLDADQPPDFSIEIVDDDIDHPILNMSLPQAQVMAEPKTTWIAPTDDPLVELDNSQINSPQLLFSLPRAIRFYYGELLDNQGTGSVTLTNEVFADYATGDYYVNETTGYIYKVVSKVDNTCEFEYIACIQAPRPTVTVTGKDPYQASGDEYVPVQPSVKQEYDRDAATWKLDFQLPRAATPTASISFIGVDEEGSVDAKPSDVDQISFNFTIPRGARVFAGEDISADGQVLKVDTALPGDIYINGTQGYVYKLAANDTWILQSEGLKGPVGDSLHIVADYQLEETEDYANSLDNGVAYIKANYTGAFSQDEVFAITWTTGDIAKDQISYWYYYIDDNTWGRVQLTGGILSLIKNAYDEDSPVDKIYSVSYINSLINSGELAAEEKTIKTYSAEKIEELISWGSFSDLIAEG